MAKARASLGPIFLSASVPDPRRDPKYFNSANLINIRDAVCGLAELVLPAGELVFGGHPAISPMIALIAQQLRRLDAVTIYQSRFFEKQIPPTTLAFGPRITWTDMDVDRATSLARMRGEMIEGPTGQPRRYTAGFFIGGMEGVEEEERMFRRAQPHAAFWPVASTGAAARLIFEDQRTEVLRQREAVRLGSTAVEELLTNALAYRDVVRALLDLP
jgi:hypothetical protein